MRGNVDGGAAPVATDGCCTAGAARCSCFYIGDCAVPAGRCTACCRAGCGLRADGHISDGIVKLCCLGCRHGNLVQCPAWLWCSKGLLHYRVPPMPTTALEPQGGSCSSQPTCWLTPCCCGGGGGGGLLGGCSVVESCKPGQRWAGKVTALLCLRYTLSALSSLAKFNSLQNGMHSL